MCMGLENGAGVPMYCYHQPMTALAMIGPNSTPQDEREAKRQAIAETRASIREEGTISHEAMCRWLESWGTGNELPPPEPCK